MDQKVRYFTSLISLKNAKYVLGKKQSIHLPDCSLEDLKHKFHRHEEHVSGGVKMYEKWRFENVVQRALSGT